MNAAAKSNKLVPSFAHKMAMPSATEGAMVDVISQFMNSSMTPAQAAERLAKASAVR
jgi:glucose/mannose transport system substrate-binding protein